jgi:hypothetical protein
MVEVAAQCESSSISRCSFFWFVWCYRCFLLFFFGSHYERKSNKKEEEEAWM